MYAYNKKHQRGPCTRTRTTPRAPGRVAELAPRLPCGSTDWYAHAAVHVLSTAALANCNPCQISKTTICFTICLFISPDLDGHRAPKNGSLTLRDQTIFFLSRYEYVLEQEVESNKVSFFQIFAFPAMESSPKNILCRPFRGGKRTTFSTSVTSSRKFCAVHWRTALTGTIEKCSSAAGWA